MKTVIVTSFTMQGLPTDFKAASKVEPNRKQIEKMIGDILDVLNLNEEILYEKFLQTNGYHKIYFYKVGDYKLIVEVERLELMEFSK